MAKNGSHIVYAISFKYGAACVIITNFEGTQNEWMNETHAGADSPQQNPKMRIEREMFNR